MTLFAGVVSIAGQIPVPEGLAAEISGAISRYPGDKPRIVQGDTHFIAQVVLPTEFVSCRYEDASGNSTVLAGEPLFPSTARTEVELLHQALLAGDDAFLARSCGSYCAAHWNAGDKRLVLVADRLGLRPIYFGVHSGMFFFSTALRVLEKLGVLTHRIDVRGVTEIAAFGYPLASRSPYEAIRTIEAGELVEVAPSGVQSRHYWRWSRIPAAGVADEDLPRAVYQSFMTAIDRRLRGETQALAGLSGGLDSRCVVAGLRERGAEVHTLNFAPVGSEDLELGKIAASALGTRHFEFSAGPADFWDRMQAAHQAWLQQIPATERSRQTHRLWSGDGGSCVLGHIYISDHIIGLMRDGNTGAAIDAYLEKNRIGVPGRLFVSRERERVLAYPRSGVSEGLQRLDGADATRRLHVFLLVNGQRRLLSKHYENIDLRRFEVITPFFDSDMVQLILGSPIEGFLHHRFYNRWLQEFQPAVAGIPWQAYPGHEPCPVPKPEGLRSQWDGWYDAKASSEIEKRNLTLAGELLRDPSLPAYLINRNVLRLARLLTGWRLGDYTHVIKCAATFARYAAATPASGRGR